MSRQEPSTPLRVRLPSDVDQPDRLLAGLTARQLAILAGTGLVLWIGWLLLHALVAPLAYLAGAALIAAAAFGIVIGRRDGVALDVWIGHALRHHRAPTIRVNAPDGVAPPPPFLAARDAAGRPPVVPAPLRLPARAITDDGLIDLGADGQVAVVEADTVNFALRTGDEQEALVAAFAGWLNALDTPTQILVRAEPADLSELAEQITRRAGSLPDPDLEAAAREHAAFLSQLAGSRELLRRRVLVCLRDPVATGAAGQWAADTAQVLAAAEISARPVHAASALAAALSDTAPRGGGWVS